MEKRKIGVTIIVVSLLLGIVLLNLIWHGRQTADDEGCFQNAECNALAYTLNTSHLGIGFLFALLSLGIYLIIFGRAEESLLQQLHEQKQHLNREEKLKIVTMLLSENEKRVFDTLLKEEGITQNTLCIKTNLSKGALSQILTDFERKDIIVRQPKGKTYAVYLKGSF